MTKKLYGARFESSIIGHKTVTVSGFLFENEERRNKHIIETVKLARVQDPNFIGIPIDFDLEED